MKILHLTTIIPAPTSLKENENNILLAIARKHEDFNNESCHYFVYIQPYTNFFLSLLKKKWRDYYFLKKKGFFEYDNRIIMVLSVPLFRHDYLLKPLINYIGFMLNKNIINRIIKKYKPDIIHSHNLSISLYFSNKIKKVYGIPYFITLRGELPKFYSQYYKRKVNAANLILSVNMHSAKMYQNLVYPQRITIIPHPIDDIFFNSKILNYPKDDTIKFITISRLLDWKNIDIVIKALGFLPSKFLYHIYGVGPEMGKLNTLISDLGLSEKVKLKGYIKHENVPDLLSKYHVFVLLSYLETFGRVYIEAMARGLPVICTENSGIDGFIEHGVQGFLVKNRNINHARDVLSRFLNEPELVKNMGEKALETSKNFTWVNIIKKYDDLYMNQNIS